MFDISAVLKITKKFAEKKATRFPYMVEWLGLICTSLPLCEMQILESPIWIFLQGAVKTVEQLSMQFINYG